MKNSNELAIPILAVIQQIPKGRVASYGQIAKLAGLPKHARLVSYVLKHLDPASNIPWYRVINSQGKLSLAKLDEYGQNIQQLKLQDEGVYMLNGKVNLKHYQWQP